MTTASSSSARCVLAVLALFLLVPTAAGAQDVDIDEVFDDEANVQAVDTGVRAYDVALAQAKAIKSGFDTAAGTDFINDLKSCYGDAAVAALANPSALLTQQIDKLTPLIPEVTATLSQYETQLITPAAAKADIQATRDQYVAAVKAADSALAQLNTTLERVYRPARVTLTDFAKLAEDGARLKACARVRNRQLAAFASVTPPAVRQQELATTEAARTDAHYNDDFRRLPAIASALANASGRDEKPGAPDRIVVSLFTALGAKKETDGTQAVFTLNLPGIINQERFRNRPAFMRHLFLRFSAPLEETGSTAPTATGDDDESPPAEGATETSVSRFSLTLGGSILDETDPRLVSHDDCYNAVAAVEPYPLTYSQEALRSVRSRRQPLYALCAKAAAYSQRLAWRIAGQVATLHEADGDRTEGEILAAALVYSPQPWIVFSPYFRRIYRPTDINELGAGISLGANLGGDVSGANAWGRLGVDVTAIATNTLGDNRNAVLNVRLVPFFAFPVFSDTYFTLSVGPQFADDATQVIANASLTFDADRITANLLTPR